MTTADWATAASGGLFAVLLAFVAWDRARLRRRLAEHRAEILGLRHDLDAARIQIVELQHLDRARTPPLGASHATGRSNLGQLEQADVADRWTAYAPPAVGSTTSASDSPFEGTRDPAVDEPIEQPSDNP